MLFYEQVYHVGVTRKGKGCGSCDGCTRKDCGECKFCLDKPTFGGPGRLKQRCIKRHCHQSSSLSKKDSTGCAAHINVRQLLVSTP